MKKKLSRKMILLLVLGLLCGAVVFYNTQPRKIIIESNLRDTSGLTVKIIEYSEWQTAVTDADGAVRFGSGAWALPFSKERIMILAVFDGKEILWEGECYKPLLGSFHLHLEEDKKP